MSETQIPTLPAPPGVEFEAYLRAGEFRLQHCTACDRQIFYPRTLCPHCGCGTLQWRAASGRGVVYSSTTVRQKPERGGDYNVAIIELAEGARMLSRIEGIAPAQIRIGMSVTAVISEADGAPLIVFQPASTLTP
jgi:uncharacterized OB-fold protein